MDAKFNNLNQNKQETFVNAIIWQDICDYKVETIIIPKRTLASFSSLRYLLHIRFKPDKETIIPTQNKVNAMRHYLNAFICI